MDIDYKLNVITPGVFDLNPLDKYDEEKKPKNAYLKSLCMFINQITNGNIEFGEGVFQQICMLVATQK